MKIKVSKQCPNEVRTQLFEWQKKGWLTIESSDNEILPHVEPSDERTQPKEKKDLPKDLPIEEQWCNKLKEVAEAISTRLNNKTIEINPRGNSGSYIFFFDSKRFCAMMDELLNNYRSDISQYLHRTKKPTGVTFIFPFLGEILNSLIFNKKELQKVDLKDVFSHLGYNSSVAVKKLSLKHKISHDLDKTLLIEKAKMIGRRL